MQETKQQLEKYERMLKNEIKEYEPKLQNEDKQKYIRAFRNMATVPLLSFVALSEVEGIEYANEALLKYSLYGGGVMGAYYLITESLYSNKKGK